MKRLNIACLLSLCVLLVLGLAGSAGAEQGTPKEKLIERVKKADVNYINVWGGASGTLSFEIKELNGSMAAGFGNLKGSGLKIDGSLNSVQNKLQCGYTGSLGQNRFSGKVFVDGSRIIFTKDLLSAIQSFDSSLIKDEDLEGLNQYLYYSDNNVSELWKALKAADPARAVPVYKEILIFLLEAVPDKYFTYSDGKIVFSIDRNGLEDVLYLILKKTVTEHERFERLMKDLEAALIPSGVSGQLKEETAAIKSSGSDGETPVSREELRELLSAVNLEKFVIMASPDPGGMINFSSAISMGQSDSQVRLLIDSNIAGGTAGQLNSNYSAVFTTTDRKESVEARLKGKNSLSNGEQKRSDTIELSVKGPGGEVLLNSAAQLDMDIKEDPNARVDIPALNAANSTDLKMLEMASSQIVEVQDQPVRVFIDGKPLRFDASPYLKDGKRVMVPVRSLAEALGFDVGWFEPNKVVMTRDGRSVIMYVNERQYTVDGTKRQMDIIPVMKNGRNMVPLRFIAEEMGCSVEYDDTTARVDLYTRAN